MGEWTPAPAAVPDRWHLERHGQDVEPDLSKTPDGHVRMFPSRERAALAAAWLNGEAKP